MPGILSGIGLPPLVTPFPDPVANYASLPATATDGDWRFVSAAGEPGSVYRYHAAGAVWLPASWWINNTTPSFLNDGWGNDLNWTPDAVKADLSANGWTLSELGAAAITDDAGSIKLLGAGGNYGRALFTYAALTTQRLGAIVTVQPLTGAGNQVSDLYFDFRDDDAADAKGIVTFSAGGVLGAMRMGITGIETLIGDGSVTIGVAGMTTVMIEMDFTSAVGIARAWPVTGNNGEAATAERQDFATNAARTIRMFAGSGASMRVDRVQCFEIGG